jgi:flagellar biosynthesis regulator FlbT
MSIQVMILGCYHMANPGLDAVNMQVDDVTTPQKQLEMVEVANALIQFQPNKIALEATSNRDDLTWEAFERFELDNLTKDKNEHVQLGFRLAHRLGHDCVYGIDTPGDFPLGAVQQFAQQRGQEDLFDNILKTAQQQTADADTIQKTATLRELLAHFNQPDRITAEMRHLYAAAISIGNHAEHPGADLNAMWYWRNANIFAKLQHLARDSDRILVIYGAGHSYWLRHWVEISSGYEMIEPNTFLDP